MVGLDGIRIGLEISVGTDSKSTPFAVLINSVGIPRIQNCEHMIIFDETFCYKALIIQ